MTVDFDAETLWSGVNGPGQPVWMARGSYDVNEGFPRLLRLFRKHDIRTTFFVPGWVADNHGNEVRMLVEDGHELGHHGYLHEAPTSLDEAGEREMIERGLEALERITGKAPIGYRAPWLEVSERTVSLLREYGFKYDSSMSAWDRPYTVGGGLTEIPARLDLIDTPQFLWGPFGDSMITSGIRSPRAVEEVWRDDFDAGYEEGDNYTYVMTVHPQHIGLPHRVAILDRLLERMKGKEGVTIGPLESILARVPAKPEQ